MKNNRLLPVLCLFLPLAGWAQGAAPEMVEVEVRFFEAKIEQMPKLMPSFGPTSNIDPIASGTLPLEGQGKPGLPAAPAILSVIGVFTAEQADKWARELKAAGAKLLEQQKTVALSGHTATIKNVRELRYPSDFDKSKTADAEGLYPIAFESRNVGFELEFEPKIGPDGYTIDLVISPRIDEFKGFVDATKIRKDALPEHLQELLKIPPKKGAAWQPVFNSRQVTTEVTVYNGQTVILSSPATPENPGTVILITARILPPQ